MTSFDTDPSVVVAGPLGQKVHRLLLDHSARLQRRLYAVRPGVWSLVGNGLSNQTFIEGPEGLIVIDTGESDEEMASALADVRKQTQAPLAAVIYTHFHYVSGTRAAFREAGRDLPVYGHERIAANKARTSTEVAPSYSRGIVHQFGVRLPPDGPDALVNVGLGMFFRNPDHAPFRNGYVPVTKSLRGDERLTIAGLKVEVTHAPSDADDSITLWFPELGVCVQNLVWPTLFNIFAIRGETYRDPQILLAGIDHVLTLAPDHVLGTHGPPLSGTDEIRVRVTAYRDSIQFLWDQTVRGMNRGLTADELAHQVRLPASFGEDYLTRELYGVAEHHVRQIAAGVSGWFDGDTAKLFPPEPGQRAARLVEGFGGAAAVRTKVAAARSAGDLRWALELASWLSARLDAEADDRQMLADVLREIAYRSSAANIRNWCLTRARDLDGSADLSRLRENRLRAPALAAMKPRDALHLIRVLVDPHRAEGIDAHVAFDFADAPRAGLHVRNCVAATTSGDGAAATLALTYADLIRLLTADVTLDEALASGSIALKGDAGVVRAAFSVFDFAASSSGR